MTSTGGLEYGPVQPEEVQPLWALLDQALHISMVPGWNDHVGPDKFRAVRRNGKLAGGMGIVLMGQWFGGASVPTGAVTSVGIAPEFRGAGAASMLMKSALDEIHEEGWPLSTLFPSTLNFYRHAGYERAGVKVVYELSTNAIDVGSRELDIAEIDDSSREEIYATYNARAKSTSGNLDRPAMLWEPIMGFGGRKVFSYLITGPSGAEGYVIFQQARSAAHIRVRDVALLTQNAALRLLRFFADHRSTIDSLSWNGAPNDLMVHALGEQDAKLTSSRDWVIRIIDVESALTARGYPATYQGELHLRVEDNLLSWNNGDYVLEVASGRGTVRRGGRGDLRTGIRGLAAMYAGHVAPVELRAMGAMDADDATIANVSLMFASPRSWMSDQF
ncbi:MAG: GNAT family N-acetyltransferase [SAR202 cluster bacterium]|jgi:predicted acetyltransferase|nr:GNAT family N-acetyltransferase [SAR202 cluster bacterium]